MATTVSFAGSGRITVAHGLALQAVGGVKVLAVASRDPAHAAERAEQMNATACRYEDLPAGADVVIVATPPARHAADVMQALERGAAVIVEKPLCTTLADADALVAAADARATDASPARVGYAENLAFAPVIERAIELCAGLGTLRHLEVRALSNRPNWGDFLHAHWGGGVLFDLGVHPLAIALLVARARPEGSSEGSSGPPPQVVSVRAHLEGGDDIEVDDYAEADLTFDTGLQARVVSSWREASPQWDLQAASDDDVIRAELLPALLLEHGGEVVGLPPVPATVEIPQIEQFGYRGQVERFLGDFAAGRAPAMSLAFGREVLDVVCAAYASAGRGGTPEAVPFTGPRDRTPLQLWRPSPT